MPTWTRRLGRIAAVALAVAALLIVSFNLYTRSTLTAPLENELAQLSFVKEVNVENRPQPRVSVSIGPVRHLREAYLELEPIIFTRFADKSIPVIIVDQRTPELIEAFYHLRPFVIEAAVRGNVAQMNKEFEQAAAQMGLSSPTSFTVDNRFLYVQLHDGENDNYMYVVEPYLNDIGEVVGAGRLQS